MPAGERNLERLLAGLDPVLHDEEFVYATGQAPGGCPTSICTFREREGVTMILPRADAERLGIEFTYPCRMITLNIHSNLNAVGLLAAVTAALAREGISVNAVSGYYHDHLFVPVQDAGRALATLRPLQSRRSSSPDPRSRPHES